MKKGVEKIKSMARVRQISDEFLVPIEININSCKTNIVIYGSGLPGLDSLTLRNEANFYK